MWKDGTALRGGGGGGGGVGALQGEGCARKATSQTQLMDAQTSAQTVNRWVYSCLITEVGDDGNSK